MIYSDKQDQNEQICRALHYLRLLTFNSAQRNTEAHVALTPMPAEDGAFVCVTNPFQRRPNNTFSKVRAPLICMSAEQSLISRHHIDNGLAGIAGNKRQQTPQPISRTLPLGANF